MPAAARVSTAPISSGEVSPNLEECPEEYFQRPVPWVCSLERRPMRGRTPMSREALSSRGISLGFSMTTMTFLPSLTPSRARRIMDSSL